MNDPHDGEASGPTLSGSSHVRCPYCGADVEFVFDPLGGDRQEYVEDCEVCCHPWSVQVDIGRDGDAVVHVGTLDEG